MDLKYKKMFADSAMKAKEKDYQFKKLDETILGFTNFISKVSIEEEIEFIKMKEWYYLVLAQAHKDQFDDGFDFEEHNLSVLGIPIVVDDDIGFTVDLVFKEKFVRRRYRG